MLVVVAVTVVDSTERVPAAVEFAAMADSYRDAAVVPRAPSDKAWAGAVEEAVVAVEVNDLLVSQQQEVVDRSLGVADVLRVQSVRWEKQVIRLGEHQAEAYPLDGR